MKLALVLIAMACTSLHAQTVVKADKLTPEQEKRLADSAQALELAQQAYRKVRDAVAKEHGMADYSWMEHSEEYEISGHFIILRHTSSIPMYTVVAQ